MSPVSRIAGIRCSSGYREPGHVHGKGLSWTAMTPEARTAALTAARAALAENPKLRVRRAESLHGIPRGYLAERLKREKYAERVTAAAADVAAGHTPLDAARHHGIRLGSLQHRLQGK